jgi:hypothetical protein
VAALPIEGNNMKKRLYLRSVNGQFSSKGSPEFPKPVMLIPPLPTLVNGKNPKLSAEARITNRNLLKNLYISFGINRSEAYRLVTITSDIAVFQELCLAGIQPKI